MTTALDSAPSHSIIEEPSAVVVATANVTDDVSSTCTITTDDTPIDQTVLSVVPLVLDNEEGDNAEDEEKKKTTKND